MIAAEGIPFFDFRRGGVHVSPIATRRRRELFLMNESEAEERSQFYSSACSCYAGNKYYYEIRFL